MRHSEQDLQALWEAACTADSALRNFMNEHGIDDSKISLPVGVPLRTEITNGNRELHDRFSALQCAAGAANRRYSFAKSENNKQVKAAERKAAEANRKAPKEDS
ncbi:hypothetical protein GCM10007094_23220 [Pseudovibrio japonicus]|uniref:Uncharacterized protein n=1 Tax=Pseudovibrio japonicus TaxID=366534 RepID=A0ABQ3ECY4_9HYPH|nr:hypothetical protein [Pseudovibrio japonicus]GHB33736.1 hypothetical protein GCM10007094_23220 [Pseudovibrio japonicus]